MNGNICPQCGKDVMPYKRFLREAEPYKHSHCGSCNALLKRSPKVFLYLVFAMIILAAISLPLLFGMMAAHLSYWIIWPVFIVWLACWVIVVNYLSWRYIGWVLVESENK